jgi:hypothetical protein
MYVHINLPHRYWQNFCKLAQAVHILHQRAIPREQLQLAQKLVDLFCIEYENIYVRHLPCRIHFM